MALYFKARLFADELPVNQIVSANGTGRQVPGSTGSNSDQDKNRKRERTNSDAKASPSGSGRTIRFCGGLRGGGASDDDDDEGEKNTGKDLKPQSICQASAILVDNPEKDSELEGNSGKSENNVITIHHPCSPKVVATNQVDVEVNPVDNNPAANLHQIAANVWYSYDASGAFYVGERQSEVIASIPHDLICPLCLHPLINAVMFCDDSHHLCLQCSRAEMKDCPLCQGTVHTPPIANHDYNCRILCCQCLCPHCNRECELGNISKHMQDCPELPQNCAFCHTDIPDSEFPAHLQQCSVSHQGDTATTEQLQQAVRQLTNIIQRAVFPVQGAEAGDSLHLLEAQTLLEPVPGFPGIYTPNGASTSSGTLFIEFNWYLDGAEEVEVYLHYSTIEVSELRISKNRILIEHYKLKLVKERDAVEAYFVLHGVAFNFWITFEIIDANGRSLFGQKNKATPKYGTAQIRLSVPVSVFKYPGRFFIKLTIHMTPPS